MSGAVSQRVRIQNLASTWRHFDFWLLGAVALLVIFGITMIRSAVAGNIELVELNLVQRQVIFAIGGMVAMVIVAAIDYRLWASISRPLFIGTVVALAVLTIVGAALFGSARWFDTGVILIQPSEIAKIVLILVLADYLTRNQHNIQSMPYVLQLPAGDAHRGADLAPAEPEHFYCNDRAVVCPAVGQRAAHPAPFAFYCRRHLSAHPGFPLPGGLPAAANLELPVSRPQRPPWRYLQHPAGPDQHRLRRSAWARLWPGHPGAAALLESALV
jgi:hypothetical protein